MSRLEELKRLVLLVNKKNRGILGFNCILKRNIVIIKEYI